MIMTPLMNALHEDHQHIRSLLTLLRNKLATLAQGRPGDFVLLGQVIDYLSEYAEQCHHRKENGLFAFLQASYPDTRDQVERQFGEHRELEALTAALRRSLEGGADLDASQRQVFVKGLSSFIDKQLSHLILEEDQLFPLIECTLTPDNWLQFHAQVPEKGDRAYERHLAQRYLELREALIEDLG
jgi:hemerythrin-like domain-containing protein